MTITDRLMSLDPTLELHDEGEWSHSHTPYKAFNDAGVECETGEFLYSMVRILKPTSVLETGTHKGIGASYMGLALLDNGFGHLDTMEFLPEIYREAVERLKKIGLYDGSPSPIVSPHLIDAAKFEPQFHYQMVLLDTEPQTRFAEMVRFYDYLDDGGFLFIHDLHRHMHQIENLEHGFAWPFGPIPTLIKQLVATDKLRPFHFPTPRGITGFYKTRPDDFKWNHYPNQADHGGLDD